LLGSSRGGPKPRALAKYSRKHVAASAIGIACLVAAAAALALHGSIRRQLPAAAVATGPLTVRALLEGEELTDLATNNLVAVSGDGMTGRDQVRAQVAHGLKNISDTLRLRYPEAHRKLEVLQLTGGQKEAALRVLRKFGDPRMVGLTRDIAETAQQAKDRGENHESLKRRLSEILAPKMHELQQLSQEMFPGKAFNFEVDAFPQLRKWHPAVEVDLPDASETQRRRLTEAAQGSSIEHGVQVQAKTLFTSLQQELGDEMPAAPARMLSSSSGEASFMTCVTQALPNPVALCQCIASNLSEVMSMMTSFMGSKR